MRQRSGMASMPAARTRGGSFNNNNGGNGDDDPNDTFVTTLGYERPPGAAEKVGNSLKGLLLGPVVVFCGCLLLWFNEEWAIKTHRSLNEALEAFVRIHDATDGQALEAHRGKLVHLTHRLSVDPRDTVEDPVFGLARPNVVSLKRQVEIYQWVEKITQKKIKRGKDTEVQEVVKYKKEWKDDPVDSTDFRHPDGHENCCGMPSGMNTQTFSANGVQLGAYTLANVLARQITQSNEIPAFQVQTLPEGVQRGSGNALLVPRGGGQATTPPRALTADEAIEETTMRMDGEERTMYRLKATGESFSTRQKAIIAFASLPLDQKTVADNRSGLQKRVGDQALIGDVRISFSEIPCTTVSVLGKLDEDYGNTIASWPSRQGSGYDVAVLRYGTVHPADMIADQQSANSAKTWALRAGGWILNLIGFSMITSIVTTTADITLNWIPFLGPMASGLISLGVTVANLVMANSTTLLVASIAWIFYRPVLGISLLAGSVGLFFGASQMGRRKQQASAGGGGGGGYAKVH